MKNLKLLKLFLGVVWVLGGFFFQTKEISFTFPPFLKIRNKKVLIGSVHLYLKRKAQSVFLHVFL